MHYQLVVTGTLINGDDQISIVILEINVMLRQVWCPDNKSKNDWHQLLGHDSDIVPFQRPLPQQPV